MTRRTSRPCAASSPASASFDPLAAALTASLLLVGCATLRAPEPAAGPPVSVRQLVGVGVSQAPSRSQFTLHVAGPEGDGVLSLTLRLRDVDRFLLTARDRVLRRRVWELALDGERALMVDHRAQSYCWYGPEVELDVVPLGPLPVASLPAMLLGRLPLGPRGEIERVGDAGEVEFLDRLRRRWRVTIAGDSVRSWTLFDAREPIVWYSEAEDGFRRLSARREGLQLRWRQVAFERPESTAEEEGAALRPPVDYRLDCP